MSHRNVCNECEHDNGVTCDKHMHGHPWRATCINFTIKKAPESFSKRAPSGIINVYSTADKTRLIRYAELP